jgi:O-methyltransferase
MSLLIAAKRLTSRALRIAGYQVRAIDRPTPDMEPEFISSFEVCKPYTYTSVERMYALYQATRYIVRSKIPGAIVECGVWRGGSMMMSALTLKQMGATDHQLYMYDTYAGMAEPTEIDGIEANHGWRSNQKQSHNAWCYAPLEEVRKNMAATRYPDDKIRFIEGKVEDTIPQTVPDQIALLRLDTDWYTSTRHELRHLFPRLSRNGVLLLDDYGHWRGARDAVNEYIETNDIPFLLHRIDYSGRLAIKV